MEANFFNDMLNVKNEIEYSIVTDLLYGISKELILEVSSADLAS